VVREIPLPPNPLIIRALHHITTCILFFVVFLLDCVSTRTSGLIFFTLSQMLCTRQENGIPFVLFSKI